MSQPDEVSRTGVVALVLGALALVLALVTLWEVRGNRALKQQMTETQQRVTKAQAMANLDNSLVQMLAKSAIDNSDPALRSLLEQNNVQLKTGPSAPVPPGAMSSGQ